jgi:hypothetical protein
MRLTVLISCLALLLSACAGSPKPATYPLNFQQKMQSVHHWEVLAQKVVELQVAPTCPPCVPAAPRPIYVDDSDRTDFGKAFHNYLLTALVNRGIQPATHPEGASVIKWGTQLVCLSKPGYDFPGVLVGTAEVVGATLFGTTIPKQKTYIEVIVTTQVEKDNFILSRHTHNFYINDDAKWAFWQPNKMAAY